MPKHSTPRRERRHKDAAPPPLPEQSKQTAARLAALMRDPETPANLYNALGDEIMELADSCGGWLNPDVLRAAYPVLCALAGRDPLAEAVGRASEPARLGRSLLTRRQYAQARVLARIIAGGYPAYEHRGYYDAIAGEERQRLRAQLVELAYLVALDPEPFISRGVTRRRRYDCTSEQHRWPHSLFVTCVKLLAERRAAGIPAKTAERLAARLGGEAERHEQAARAHKAEPSPRTTGREDEPRGQKLSELRARLDELRRRADITDSTEIFRLKREIHDLEREALSDEWPEVIDG